ncbi:MAG: CoA-binding protein [Chloroflexi bacterium]|nr:CoA-binding protein [Chloroflexota bacterium]
MSTIDPLVKDFLAQKRIAVAGVSRTREDAANRIYRKLRGAGYRVFAINPNAGAFGNDPCYPNLKSVPEPVDGVVLVTRPAVTEQIVSECIKLAIPRVWMHCSLGSRPRLAPKLAAAITSVSQEAIRLCRENNIAVIPGGCPMMFCAPVDFGHTCMRWILRLTGGLSD